MSYVVKWVIILVVVGLLLRYLARNYIKEKLQERAAAPPADQPPADDEYPEGWGPGVGGGIVSDTPLATVPVTPSGVPIASPRPVKWPAPGVDAPRTPAGSRLHVGRYLRPDATPPRSFTRDTLDLHG